MTRGIEPELDRIRRLGKIERQQWRDSLKDASSRLRMQDSIADLLNGCGSMADDDMEDIFIFGAQIANIWPTDDLVLALDDISAKTVAFVQGFKGADFESCFEDGVLERLRESALELSTPPMALIRNRPIQTGVPIKAGGQSGQPSGARTIRLPSAHAAA